MSRCSILLCALAHNPVYRGMTQHLKSCVWFSAPQDKTNIEGLEHGQRRATELGKSDGQ